MKLQSININVTEPVREGDLDIYRVGVYYLDGSRTRNETASFKTSEEVVKEITDILKKG